MRNAMARFSLRPARLARGRRGGSRRGRRMRQAPVALLALALATCLFGSAAAAQSLDDLAAKFKQRCEQLRQEKEKIQQAAQSPAATPEQKTQATQAAADLDKIITTTTALLDDPAVKAGGHQRDEILARAQSAIVAGNVVASATESHLGIARSGGPADHVVAAHVDIDGLLTKVSRFDGSRTYVNDDGGYAGVGVGNSFFSGSPSPPVQAAATYTPSTPQSAAAIVAHDGSVGGGVMLEDVAAGLGQPASVRYDGRYGALVVNDRLVYFMKVLPWDAAALCREIAQDKRTLVGVSMGAKVLIFGDNPALYQNSDVGRTLLLTDHFLGDFVFGWNNWTKGYKFPDNYLPKTADVTADMLVRFAFKSFRFEAQNDQLQLANLAVDVTMMPVSKAQATNGGMLPDEDALRRGYAPPAAFLANTQYFTAHFDFFRRERIVAKTIAYGELAALFRAFKQAGLNLDTLAAELESG